MIIGDKRRCVIERIRQATENGTFNSKVEEDDPVLTEEQLESLLVNYVKRRSSMKFHINNWVAKQIVNCAAGMINKTTRINGQENINGITGGAILTSNHFSQIDSTVMHTLVRRVGKKKFYIVIKEANLNMSGWVGFLMNYADTIPISTNCSYMFQQFEPMLEGLLDKSNYVLMYPEQEMWFHYRKPRPLKRGAYYYAAKFNVPIISCFVEICDLEELDTPEFHKVRYVLHILPPIYPDPEKTCRENSFVMCARDYQQKKEAYESAYGKPLDYLFESEDIAGWIASSDIADKTVGLQEIC